MSCVLVEVADLGVIIRDYICSPTPEQKAEIVGAVREMLYHRFDKGGQKGFSEEKKSFLEILELLDGEFPEKKELINGLRAPVNSLASQILKVSVRRG